MYLQLARAGWRRASLRHVVISLQRQHESPGQLNDWWWVWFKYNTTDYKGFTIWLFICCFLKKYPWVLFFILGHISLHGRLLVQCSHFSPHGTNQYIEREWTLSRPLLSSVSIPRLTLCVSLCPERKCEGVAAQCGIWGCSGHADYDDGTHGASPGLWTLGRWVQTKWYLCRIIRLLSLVWFWLPAG